MTTPQKKTVDFSRSAISRYIQLATLFRQRIDSGQWVVGAQIPTVEELSAECGVARATIRQALDLLEEEKLIERFRAKGTFVRRRPQEELWCAVGTDWSGLLRPSHAARIEVLSDEGNVILSDVPYMSGNYAESYRHLHRRHWRHDEPFLLTDVYVDERLRDLISQEDIETKTALSLVHNLEGVDIVDAQQTLTVGTADVETAEWLSMPINAPVAHVYRRAVDSNGIAVLIAQGTYVGKVVRFDVKLR
ncbi:GntR family transcriptional regulator [Mariluticola halotolerans]|uniref:GntR family transcriptional regulator n=1 Tax=Mariluticola halotolerans TaxID=2909283 RepID=UPI0026E20DA0|nr:GntR family transcriptional regulator [Mariluticola halotolerans]UJQ94173.1 GntR family transcriptional regulator [Mariluticola halotolerans]